MGDDLEPKDFKEKIIKKIVDDMKLDKKIVKEIEFKNDQIRSLFSYNSKYQNYSVPSNKDEPVETDIENSKKYNPKLGVYDFNLLINKVNENAKFLEILTEAERKKQSEKQSATLFNLIGDIITKMKINSKSQLTDGQINEIVDTVIKTNKTSAITARKMIFSYLNASRSTTFYDTLIEHGVKDCRKRLLWLVVVPYFNIKFKNDKKMIEDAVYSWLLKSNVTQSGFWHYRTEIKSLIERIQPGVRPTSINSLLSRLGYNMEDLKNLINS